MKLSVSKEYLGGVAVLHQSQRFTKSQRGEAVRNHIGHLISQIRETADNRSILVADNSIHKPDPNRWRPPVAIEEDQRLVPRHAEELRKLLLHSRVDRIQSGLQVRNVGCSFLQHDHPAAVAAPPLRVVELLHTLGPSSLDLARGDHGRTPHAFAHAFALALEESGRQFGRLLTEFNEPIFIE
jgi:hypothetical protein